MSNKEPEKEPSGLDALFGEDEIMLEIDIKNITPEILRQMDGIAYMTEVAMVLRLSEHHFRLFAAREDAKGVDTYQKYGLRKDVGKWKVNLQRFFGKWGVIKKHMQPKKILPKYKRIPINISRKAFFSQKGVYKLNHLANPKLNEGKGFLPLTKREILALVQRQKLDRKTHGMWREGRLWYCQFEVFLPWLLSVWRHIPLEEARILVDRSC